MKRVSMATADAVGGGFGLKEGYAQIVGIRSLIHQYPTSKKTGEQSAPFPCVQIDFQSLDKDMKPTGEDIRQNEFSVGAMENYHPITLKNAQDEDPEDMGEDVGAEGNAIGSPTGKALSKQCKWFHFTRTLEEGGFPPKTLALGYLPDLIGTKVELGEIPIPKGPNFTGDKDPTAVVVKKVIALPTDKKGSKTAAPAKSAAPAKAVKAAAPAPPAEESGEGEDPNDSEAARLLGVVGGNNSGNTIKLTELKKQFQKQLMAERIAVGSHKALLSKISDSEWLESHQTNDDGDVLFTIDGDEVTFA